MMDRSFRVYIICTPIGNLEDINMRSREAIASADMLLAEDTRKARILLGRLGLEAKVRPYHDHNKERVTPGIIAELKRGASAALISDAGTPGISDPGYYLIRGLIEEGMEYTVVPGPSAVTTALVLSGFEPDRFQFLGYMPRKKGARERAIADAGAYHGTSIFFESPHRLLRTLESIDAALPGREICIAREMTKLHEEVRRGSAAELIAYFSGAKVRGEITLLLRGTGRKG